MNKDELKEKINQITTQEKKEAVMENPALLWRAFLFFQNRLCRKCRVITMNKAQLGKQLDPDWLCPTCQRIYYKEING